MPDLSCSEDLRYWPAADVRHVRLGGRAAFFCERDQRLYELNVTADAIWTALERGEPAQDALIAMGADERLAEIYVADQLAVWLDRGHWTADEASQTGRLCLSVDGLNVRIDCGDLEVLKRLRAVFAPFPAFAGAAAVRFDIEATEDGYDIAEDGDAPIRASAEALIPQVKALLTRRLVDKPRPGFFAHGALLAADGCTALISGAPGAGKTTLALALAAAGWSLAADDVIRVDGDGLLAGVPFAPAIKAGAWPLLAGRLPGLDAWPIDQRPDGQRVRYALGWTRRAEAKALDLFIALDRDGGTHARSQPIDQLEALAMLLSEAYAADHRLSADLMARLAERFQTVRCVRLAYGDLDSAVAQIGRLGSALRHAA